MYYQCAWKKTDKKLDRKLNEISFVARTPETQHQRSVIAERKKHGNVRIMDMPA
jgi:hypothetical protein